MEAEGGAPAPPPASAPSEQPRGPPPAEVKRAPESSRREGHQSSGGGTSDRHRREGKQVDQWTLTEVIGHGSFAKVWKAYHRETGEEAAIKEIATERLNRKLQESLASEIAVMQRVSRSRHADALQRTPAFFAPTTLASAHPFVR